MIRQGVGRLKNVVYGILAIVIGFVFIMLTAIFFQNGSDGPVNAGTVNNVFMVLIMAILFLCGTMIVCTFMIVDALKKAGTKHGTH
jgi:hypothetical protein